MVSTLIILFASGFCLLLVWVILHSGLPPIRSLGDWEANKHEVGASIAGLGWEERPDVDEAGTTGQGRSESEVGPRGRRVDIRRASASCKLAASTALLEAEMAISWVDGVGSGVRVAV